ncbi:hypothetical protein COLO4_24892 [Corchorus olitorius]|uniref:Prolamin-like domain-containing protein n=1 Tax=Corchorus olitorius TaxID=93759 RepID=A0A1R3I5Y9_9ROSI|nr:hypothetical protein COLO4_24892 [Corchorus olitorius]
MACIIMIAASNVPMGSAEETQGIAECFSSLSSIEGCIEAIDKAVSDKDIKDLGPACCKAIIQLGDNCWPVVFPNHPFVPFLLKTVYQLTGNAKKLTAEEEAYAEAPFSSAPAPYY